MRPTNHRLRTEVLRIVELKMQEGAKRAREKYSEVAAACNVKTNTLARAVCIELRKRQAREPKRSDKFSPEERASPEYRSWRSMLSRCENPSHDAYSRYGGRGIRVCEQWHEFKIFLADMGKRPDGKTLDRINNDGNYEPGNCRWATASEQAFNRRRKSINRDPIHVEQNRTTQP